MMFFSESMRPGFLYNTQSHYSSCEQLSTDIHSQGGNCIHDNTLRYFCSI